MSGEAGFGSMPLARFTEQLASGNPVPGGGSASAVAAALAASLVAMVIRVSQGKPRYEAHASLHDEVLVTAERSRIHALELADADAEAFTSLSAAWRLPRETQEEQAERESQVRRAARAATLVPLEVVQECHRLIGEAERLAGRINQNASSDLDVAALLLVAAGRGAAANVVVNLPSVGDPAFADAVLSEMEERLRQIQGATSRIRQVVRSQRARRPEA